MTITASLGCIVDNNVDFFKPIFHDLDEIVGIHIWVTIYKLINMKLWIKKACSFHSKKIEKEGTAPLQIVTQC